MARAFSTVQRMADSLSDIDRFPYCGNLTIDESQDSRFIVNLELDEHSSMTGTTEKGITPLMVYPLRF